MEHHVGRLGTHFQEEAVLLRHCESESAEHLVKERRTSQIVQERLHHENLEVAALGSELHQAHGQA
eukprot:12920103-Prorocentrum_lima.AAC.1